jgi:hypothetical protein
MTVLTSFTSMISYDTNQRVNPLHTAPLSPVDDTQRMKVVQCQQQLSQVKLDVLFRKHDLIGEAVEEIATT